jgi:hypothetical protein
MESIRIRVRIAISTSSNANRYREHRALLILHTSREHNYYSASSTPTSTSPNCSFRILRNQPSPPRRPFHYLCPKSQSTTPSRSPNSSHVTNPPFPNLNFPLPFLLTHIFVLLSQPTVHPSTIKPIASQESESSVDSDSDFVGPFAGMGDEIAIVSRRGAVNLVRRGHGMAMLSRRGLAEWATKRHGMAILL